MEAGTPIRKKRVGAGLHRGGWCRDGEKGGVHRRHTWEPRSAHLESLFYGDESVGDDSEWLPADQQPPGF